MQRIPEPYECIGAYLAHENVMGDLCSGKRSLILIGRAVLNKLSVESNAQFDRLKTSVLDDSARALTRASTVQLRAGGRLPPGTLVTP